MESSEEEQSAVHGPEFAWRVHGALDSWTGKVDTKASITLAIESAILGFAISLSKEDEPLADLTGASECWFYIGLGLLMLAVGCALAVVFPQLNRRQSRRDWKTNMIYFGHLRHWEPKDLAQALERDQLYGEQLATQLVAMAKIAWKKHVRLQVSVILLALGVVALVLAAATT